jgi:RNA polymerase sigma-70 factor (ECF subfamily)
MNWKADKIKEPDMDDLQLVRAVQADNRAAFDSLVVKYQDSIFNLCFRMLGDYDEARDSAQETFIKVYRNINAFKFKSAFSTWLYRIAINTCKNNISSFSYRMRKKTIRLDAPARDMEDDDNASIDVRDDSSNPADIYENKEREMIIQKAIESLPAKQRMLVVLRDIEGKSYEEIVEITGFKEGTVKSKLSRARQELRDKLRGVI